MRHHAMFAAVLCGALLGAPGCAKIESRDLIREGNALYADAKYAEAIEKYDAAEKLDPEGVTLYWNRACAAESMVLKIKDPERREERKRFADIALGDFQKWLERAEAPTEEDKKQVHDHRLAILDADERCTDLEQYWIEKSKNNPGEEGLYMVIARQFDKCGETEKADEWYVKRTQEFPKSAKAWQALAVRRFDPLWPDPDSGLPYNQNLVVDERLKAANEVIAALDKATAADPKLRDAYVWRSMAYTQRSLARVIVEPAESPEEKLEALLAREDSLLAWKQQKAVCDLDELKECPEDLSKLPEGQGCCPKPPITTEEQVADQALRAELEKEIAAAAEKAAKKAGR